MKTLLTTLAIALIAIQSFADGVVIVDANQGIYLKLINSNIDVDVNNQVALVTSKQTFVNNTSSPALVKYGFPMPASGTATQLRWKINNVWNYAEFSASAQDTTLPGSNPSNPVNTNLQYYLGSNPLYFSILDSVQINDTIEVEVTYVQLLEYKFNKVYFEYPSDYSLIQNTIIEQFQSFNFHLFSERTIDSLEMETYYPSVSNNGNIADLSYIEYGSTSVEDYKVIYQLASDELGLISFSTYLPDTLQNCDSLGNGFLGLIVEPESNDNTLVIEKVFTLIIDQSGSMSGQKIEQAKEAATFIVNNLNHGDYFNIICFSSTVTSFQPQHVEFNPANQNTALAYISNINAGGGTNINDALITAINQFGTIDTTKANIIIFFTDGQATSGITNTQSILDNVENAVNYNETNVFLFTFGIGTSTNEQLLTLLALNNQGLSEFIGNQDVSTVIPEFYLTIRNPVLLNTQISFSPNIISEVYPNPLPNLYKGMQLILAGRYDIPQNITVTLSGNAFNTNVSYSYDIALSDSLNQNVMFMPKLWAKKKIEYLTYLFYTLPSGIIADSTQTLIEEISLCYQVISTFTSFTDNTGGGVVEIEELIEEKEEFSNSFYPNPFQSETTININLTKNQEIVLTIFDVNGKLVKTQLIDGIAGENVIKWNGKDNNGQDITNGMYFYKITFEEGSFFGKLVKE